MRNTPGADNELADSFPTESAAIVFGDFLSAHIGCRTEVLRLKTHTGIETVWYRVAVPMKHLKRAEDLRSAWTAALSVVGKSEASL